MDTINEHDLDFHVKILGWAHIIGNILFLALGITGFVFMTGIGAISGDFEAIKVLGFIGTVGLIFFTCLALPGFIAGYGLLKRRPWSRVLAVVVGLLSLINFPIGTIIGFYTLFVLFQNSATPYFINLKPA
jgi:hypothetical protein